MDGRVGGGCKKLYNLPLGALIDMGDFAGGMLKIFAQPYAVPRTWPAVLERSPSLHRVRSISIHHAARLISTGSPGSAGARRRADAASTAAQEVEELARSIRFDLGRRWERAGTGNHTQSSENFPLLEAEVLIIGREAGKIMAVPSRILILGAPRGP